METALLGWCSHVVMQQRIFLSFPLSSYTADRQSHVLQHISTPSADAGQLVYAGRAVETCSGLQVHNLPQGLPPAPRRLPCLASLGASNTYYCNTWVISYYGHAGSTGRARGKVVPDAQPPAARCSNIPGCTSDRRCAPRHACVGAAVVAAVVAVATVVAAVAVGVGRQGRTSSSVLPPLTVEGLPTWERTHDVRTTQSLVLRTTRCANQLRGPPI